MLVLRFRRGVLDKELLEKAKVQDPNLGPMHFRFLNALGVPDAGEARKDPVEEGKASQVEQLKLLDEGKKRLVKETKMWEDHNHKLSVWQASHHALRQDALDKARAGNKAAVEAHQEMIAPVRYLESTAHVNTFVQGCAQVFCDLENTDKALAYQVYWIDLTRIGYDCLAGLEQAAAIATADVIIVATRLCFPCIVPLPVTARGLTFAVDSNGWIPAGATARKGGVGRALALSMECTGSVCA